MIAAPAGKLRHQHAVRIRGRAELRFDRGDRLGMPFQANAERSGGRLPRVIVRRRADAAEAEHDIAAGEGLAQRGRQRVAIVALVTRPVEHEPARGERRDDVREVTVLPFAGEDLVADDQRADAGS